MGISIMHYELIPSTCNFFRKTAVDVTKYFEYILTHSFFLDFYEANFSVVQGQIDNTFENDE